MSRYGLYALTQAGESLRFSRSKEEDEDPHWAGWTIDPKLLPLEQMKKDGYGVEEVEDKRGKYYKIIRLTLEK